jgi:CheY-like chemotaxis protein
MGYAELSLFDEVSAMDRRAYLRQVLAAAERGRAVVRQIVEFSRKTTAGKTPANLGPIITEALSLLRATLPATIELQADIDFDAPPALADAAQIQQLVVNLGHNAAQAMAQAGLLYVGLSTVELTTRKDTLFTSLPPGRYLRLTVSDTGTGIAPDQVGRIFEPFFTTREVGKGSGLGLAVVHNIVDTHQGGVVVESRLGQGSAFIVYLPAGESAGAGSAPGERPVIVGGAERILLVEDEEPLAEVLLKRLSRLGYRVTMTTSPLEALRLFERDPAAFDLVVTDMSMPRMSGAELAKRLLASRPETRVILCTGFSEEISEDKARALGIKRFLLKPLSVQELAAAVREVLDLA